VGDQGEFGKLRLYLCSDHPGGKSIGLAIADARKRQASDRSLASRGISSASYLDALADLENPKTRERLESAGILKPHQEKDGEKS
jgi:hypothetical protein